MPEHTPGPWFAQRWWEIIDLDPATEDESFRDDMLNSPYIRIATSDNETIVHCHDLCKIKPADAFLMAASPKLLEALESITDHLERVGDTRKDAPFIEAARKALSKARGEYTPVKAVEDKENKEDEDWYAY